MDGHVEFGIGTFGDLTVDEQGRPLTAAQTLRNIVEQAELADQLGLDYIGVGEHHRKEFSVSAPDVVLAAIAARTSRIKLGTAVVVLSTDDPVRVLERFSTLQALSDGRAELTVGRGSFTESFPLFGFDLAQYEELFSERLELLAALRGGGPVTWQGSTRAPLTAGVIHPPFEKPLPVWVGVGGSPESVIRAARYGLGLMLAVIGGSPQRFAPYVDLYHRAMEQFGFPAGPVGMHSPGHVADDAEQARDDAWRYSQALMASIGRERGWAPRPRESFDAETGPHGAQFVGDPEQVASKIAAAVRDLGLTRFELKYSGGTLPHPKLLRSIELYATKVVPRVRELLAEPGADRVC